MAAVVARPKLLTIETVADDAGVIVSVKDSGVGVEELVLERVFEPFYTTKPRGLGIGLAMTRAIVQAHGGRIWVVATETSGATFRLQLPFNRTPAE
jgi:signal transduction histidine kinase